MLPLRCAVQSYPWGVPASKQSKVQSLAAANGVEAASSPSPDTRFSELWVGTHPSGCCQIRPGAGNATNSSRSSSSSSKDLEAWLAARPEALGAAVADARPTGGDAGRLPFLMKVLSIDKALPLQAHPTPSGAKALHAQQPEVYPDAAAKPEMVVALSGFCGFAGFLAFDMMSRLLHGHPRLAGALGDANVQRYLAAGQADDRGRQQALKGPLIGLTDS